MPRLVRAMGGDQVATGVRGKRARDERSRGGDEAVDHDGDPGRRPRRVSAPAMTPISRPPDGRQGADRIGRVGAVDGRGPSLTPCACARGLASSMPVPRPVISAGVRPVKTQARRWTASCCRCPCRRCRPGRCRRPAAPSATSMPASRDRTASSRLMAGPMLRSAVPSRTLRSSTPPSRRPLRSRPRPDRPEAHADRRPRRRPRPSPGRPPPRPGR